MSQEIVAPIVVVCLLVVIAVKVWNMIADFALPSPRTKVRATAFSMNTSLGFTEVIQLADAVAQAASASDFMASMARENTGADRAAYVVGSPMIRNLSGGGSAVMGRGELLWRRDDEICQVSFVPGEIEEFDSTVLLVTIGKYSPALDLFERFSRDLQARLTEAENSPGSRPTSATTVQTDHVPEVVSAPQTPMPSAGWYPDPNGRFEHRYWDGSVWTSHVAHRGVQSESPL